ncbi:MAG: hypothetical protein HYT89_02280 [Candidatus Omnitrophica bacterium]|nr:hypothetical protein [Candidatus Omnitrophota bacterium]
MKPIRRAASVALVAALFLWAPVPAFSRQDTDFLKDRDKKVSIDLRDSDVLDVLKFLAQRGKFNIFISPGIQGRVTLFLEDVRISDILDIILLSNGLAYRVKDSIVYIMPQEEYKARYGEEYDDAREAQIIKLKYASPAQVFKMLEPTKSAIGTIVIDEETGTVILMETSEKMKLMTKIIDEVDQPLETKVFDLGYAKAEDVLTLLQAKIEDQAVGSIHADTRTNQIVVTALANRMKEIEGLVGHLDRKTREVVIDAKIVKVELSNDNRRGINWEAVFLKGPWEPLDATVALPNSNITSTTLGSLQYNVLAADGMNFLLKVLGKYGETKILASPSVTVVEGEEAKVLVGSRQPYVTSTTTTGTGGNAVSESISFIDVGTSLTVSALINQYGYVTMKIRPEISSTSDTPLTTGEGNKIPIVDTTTAETRVMVKDGTTIVIGGLLKDEKKHTSDRIPILHKIPVVGYLFKQNNTELDQSEIVVFLTPRIIEGDTNMMSPTKPSGLGAKGLQAYSTGQASGGGGQGPEGAESPGSVTMPESGVLEVKAMQAYPKAMPER